MQSVGGLVRLRDAAIGAVNVLACQCFEQCPVEAAAQPAARVAGRAIDAGFDRGGVRLPLLEFGGTGPADGSVAQCRNEAAIAATACELLQPVLPLRERA